MVVPRALFGRTYASRAYVVVGGAEVSPVCASSQSSTTPIWYMGAWRLMLSGAGAAPAADAGGRPSSASTVVVRALTEVTTVVDPGVKAYRRSTVPFSYWKAHLYGWPRMQPTTGGVGEPGKRRRIGRLLEDRRKHQLVHALVPPKRISGEVRSGQQRRWQCQLTTGQADRCMQQRQHTSSI